MTPRIGLSDVPPREVKISKWCKDKRSLIQYIMSEEAENDKGDNVMSNSKSPMFDRLQPSTPQQRPSIFSKIGKDKNPNLFYFID